MTSSINPKKITARDLFTGIKKKIEETKEDPVTEIGVNVLKFIITDAKYPLKNRETGTCANFRVICLMDKTNAIRILHLKPKIEGFDALEVYRYNIAEDKLLNISESLDCRLKSTVLDIISKGVPDPSYCCVDFFATVHGVYNSDNINNLMGVWNASICHDHFFKPNEGLFYSKWNEENDKIPAVGRGSFHFGFSLGENLSISVLGVSGPLAVTTHREISKLYKVNSTWKFQLAETSEDSIIKFNP
ncbi:MAG: hypothetical protein VX777_06610 [Chlamydiota bacterium]|nr:hypothetical protein [Chlamydiota bacterium]